jgi:hypothetical protein
MKGWGPIHRVILQVEEQTLQNYAKQIENTLVNHLLHWAEDNDGKYETYPILLFSLNLSRSRLRIAIKTRDVIRKCLPLGRLTLVAKVEELICPYVLSFKGQSLFKTKTVVFDIILPLISAFFQKVPYSLTVLFSKIVLSPAMQRPQRHSLSLTELYLQSP